MTTVSNPFIQADGRKPTCVEMLQLILDGQATSEQQNYFRQHMDKCLPCYKNYNMDMAIKEMLKTKCCGGDIPAELIEELKAKINQKISS